MDFKMSEQQTFEEQILDSIKKIGRGLDVMVRIQLELIHHRSRFKNQIAAYRSEYCKKEIDDLIWAIVKDNAIPPEEICLAFDLNLVTLRERLEQIKRDRGITL